MSNYQSTVNSGDVKNHPLDKHIYKFISTPRGFISLLAIAVGLLVFTLALWQNESNNSRLAIKSQAAENQQIVLQQGVNQYNGINDTVLRSDRPSRNYATDSKLTVQADNWIESVIRFDLATVPVGRRIERAYIEFYLKSKNDDRKSFTLGLYQLLRPWIENEANWLQATKSERWGKEGADKVDVDRVGRPAAIGLVNEVNNWYAFDITNLVQEWLNNPSRNYGVILRGDNSNNVEFRFASSNDSTFNYRPKLTIWLSSEANISPAPTLVVVSPTAFPTAISSVPTMLPTLTVAPSLTPTIIRLPTATPTRTSIQSGNWWRPTAERPIHFHWQIGTDFNPATDFLPGVTVYDIDGFNTTVATVAAIHARGYIAICYIDVGGWEAYRDDASAFPPSVRGNKMQGWDEYWLDIRSPAVRAGMANRIKTQCADKGFDAVEPDVIDAYSNNSGFPLTYQDQIEYNKFIAETIHSYGMSAGLKGDIDQVKDLVNYFDWTLNEECAQYNECSLLNPFIAANKAVFQVEYRGGTTFCADANRNRRNAQLRNLELTKSGTRIPCVPDNIDSWPQSMIAL